MRRCSKCCDVKKDSEFHKNRTMPGGIAYMCKVCRTKYDKNNCGTKEEWAKYMKTWYSKQNDESRKKMRKADRKNKLRRKYHITPKEYEIILKKQKGVCAICGREEWSMIKGKVVRLAIDHCHKTENVRGLLCRRCNVTLGFVEEEIGLLMSMIEYIKGGCDGS